MLLVIRTVFVLFSIGVIVGIRRIRKVTFYDALLFLWWLALFGVIIIVDISRPAEYVQNQLIYVLGAFACYTVIPLPRILRFIPAFALSIGALAILHFLKTPLPNTSLQVIVASYIIMNIMSVLISARMYSFRRRQYIAQKNEAEAIKKQEIFATTDSLTGISNRRRFIEFINMEQSRYRRNQRPFALLMGDFDHFIEINDTYGHQMGDDVQTQFSKLIIEQKRYQDSVGRLGGEEFGMLFPETDIEGAIPFAERLRKGCSQMPIANAEQSLLGNISVGIATLKLDDLSIDPLIRRADEALYRAKNLGRNRFEVSY
jgi:diguanylate cyclase (GGDEF)-like protein